MISSVTDQNMASAWRREIRGWSMDLGDGGDGFDISKLAEFVTGGHMVWSISNRAHPHPHQIQCIDKCCIGRLCLHQLTRTDWCQNPRRRYDTSGKDDHDQGICLLRHRFGSS